MRASFYALFGCVAALAAVFLTPWVPSQMAERLGGESVEAILAILASSLLAVATFSLGAMVSAYTAVSQAASPVRLRTLYPTSSSSDFNVVAMSTSSSTIIRVLPARGMVIVFPQAQSTL